MKKEFKKKYIGKTVKIFNYGLYWNGIIGIIKDNYICHDDWYFNDPTEVFLIETVDRKEYDHLKIDNLEFLD